MALVFGMLSLWLWDVFPAWLSLKPPAYCTVFHWSLFFSVFFFFSSPHSRLHCDETECGHLRSLEFSLHLLQFSLPLLSASLVLSLLRSLTFRLHCCRLAQRRFSRPNVHWPSNCQVFFVRCVFLSIQTGDRRWCLSVVSCLQNIFALHFHYDHRPDDQLNQEAVWVAAAAVAAAGIQWLIGVFNIWNAINDSHPPPRQPSLGWPNCGW